MQTYIYICLYSSIYDLHVHKFIMRCIDIIIYMYLYIWVEQAGDLKVWSKSKRSVVGLNVLFVGDDSSWLQLLNLESHVQVSEPWVDYIIENEHFESQTLRFGSDQVPFQLDDFFGARFFLTDVPGPSLKLMKHRDWKMSFLFGSWPPDRCQLRVHFFSAPENDGFSESFGRCQVATQLYKLVAEEGHGWGEGRSCTVGNF